MAPTAFGLRRRLLERCEATKRGRDRLFRPGLAPKKQIVVCGCPRSGTSLLYNMLSATLEGFAFKRFEHPAADLLWRYENVASKRPLDVLEVAELPRHNIHGKQLYAVATIRDPRDIMVSIHPTGPFDRYYIGYAMHWGFDRATGNQVPVPIGMKHVHEAIERARTVEGIKLILVRYDDLIDKPDAVQAGLAEDLEVTFARPFSEFHKYRDKHAFAYTNRTAPQTHEEELANKPIDKSRRGKWRGEEHRPRIQEEFTAYPALFNLLREYGYEQDDSWFEPYREGASRVGSD